VIAVDTNILVYARRAEMPFHNAARDLLRQLSEGETAWAVPWPCLYEYVRVVTHPRVFDPPTTLEAALSDVEHLLSSPPVVVIGEGPRHLAAMRQALVSSQATANLVHNAHIAALCSEHGVRELWTADRDFSRFPGLRVRHPFA
jgi:toxin-antitoxin system PIN domain toxin